MVVKMCIAIPLGTHKQTDEAALWHVIRTTPLYLLGLGSLVQLLLLGIFLLALSTGLISAQSLLLTPEMISTYMLVFGVSGFVFFALTMHYYPHLMKTGNIEYLYYGGFFYLTTYNLLFFYLAVFFSNALLIGSIVIQLLLFIFAFQPLRQAAFWAVGQHRQAVYFLHTLFILFVAGMLLFIGLIV